MIGRALAAALLLAGCANLPKTLAEVKAKHGKPAWGQMVGHGLEDGDKQLEIFVQVPGRRERLWCVARNREKDALRYIHRKLEKHPGSKDVGVYFHEVEGMFKWWFDGPDCSMKVVAVWREEADRYSYLNPLHSTSWRDWISMKAILKGALEVKKAIP